MLTVPGLGPGEARAVFVDPGTGEVRGDLTVYGTSGALPLRTWVDQLHRNLHLGDPGRLYSELAASWLGIVALAGLGLFFPLVGYTPAAFVVVDVITALANRRPPTPTTLSLIHI
ncbi:PepSY domain-containing protein [Myceligenerans sp. I2]|uniref:PepSY domain-containing protein n=1 Tax=Myceligenerans indicum TaxID=2593663 RepID=A0ABS1LRB1_9MICO|nr:PepSY domain-containing protein [Myceligenerans indicum]